MTAVVLTPCIDGRDGLSALSRQVTQAIHELCPGATLVTLSLLGPSSIASASGRVTGCGGSRIRLAAHTLAAAASRPDLLIVLHAHLLPLAWPFVAAGTSIVHVLVGIEAWRPFSALQSRLLARARAIVAISEHTTRRFLDANPRSARQGIQVCRPFTPPRAAPERRVDHPRAGYALIVGRMAAEERYKGHDILIDAWNQVRASVPDARLVIVGDGDDAPRLRARVAEHGLSEAIHFAGRVTDGALTALYDDAAAFVLPSANEGFGYVFLEAMASGCACIGARGSAEEIIVEGETGLIVDGLDVEHVASALIRLIGRPDEARRLGAAGRERACTAFSSARFVGDLGSILRPVLAC
jgi:phosphatidylinositol alpha-1,6-mannosyltransferase